MRKFLIALISFTIAFSASAQEFTYPKGSWSTISAKKAGYNAKKLAKVEKYISDNMQTTGMIVIVGGKVLLEYGNLTEISYIASCRKSVLSMMYGKYVENGTIDLDKTLGELGVDDLQGLLPIEKQATIRHLISARSGVYHPASNIGDDAKNAPKRGSKEPGSYYLYNNWDFNVAGDLFEQLTGRGIYEVFWDDIGKKIELEDFKLTNQRKGGNPKLSKYPPYHIYVSTRDMARIGYLMLRRGNWNGTQVISEDWVDKMLTPYTRRADMHRPASSNFWEYGYMWWLFDKDSSPSFLEGAYSARGYKGQYITVIPKLDMVVAHKTVLKGGRSTKWGDYHTVLKMLYEAKK